MEEDCHGVVRCWRGARWGLAMGGSVFIGGGTTVLWLWLKKSCFPQPYVSLAFFTVVAAVLAGGLLRLLTDGGFFAASFAVLVTIGTGLTGGALEYRIDLQNRLNLVLDAAWDETLEYAQRTVPDPWITGKKWTDASPQCFLIGLLASRETAGHADYWMRRNLLFTHWIACRQLTTYGQTGRDRTIWEATRLIKEPFFIDAWLLRHADDAVNDGDVSVFQRDELPHLRELCEGKVAREAFKARLMDEIMRRTTWGMLLWGGFGPVLAVSLFLAVVAAHKLAGNFSEIADTLNEGG